MPLVFRVSRVLFIALFCIITDNSPLALGCYKDKKCKGISPKDIKPDVTKNLELHKGGEAEDIKFIQLAPQKMTLSMIPEVEKQVEFKVAVSLFVNHNHLPTILEVRNQLYLTKIKS